MGPEKPTRKCKQERITHTKRITKVEREKLLCKNKLDTLELEETQTKDDRFSPEEKKLLLEAYYEKGYQVFQDTKLLHQYLPLRRENDLKGLVERLRMSFLTGSQATPKQEEDRRADNVDNWCKLSSQMMRNFAKDKKVNLDYVFADALMELADREVSDEDESKPNYPKLLKSFAQLMSGKFPDSMKPVNAQISMKLFDHINQVLESLDFKTAFKDLENGTWLEETFQSRSEIQEAAVRRLAESDVQKEALTLHHLKTDRNIQALCLELPKIKRIRDVFNPLHIGETMMSNLLRQHPFDTSG